MDGYDKTIRLSFYVLICAVLLRLSTTGFFTPLVELLTQESVLKAVWLLETGRTLPAEEPPTPTRPAPTIEPLATEPTEVSLPDRWDPAQLWDAGSVRINSYCGYEPQVEAWLEQPLNWQLRQAEPTVLIYHSHATESYEHTPYRTEAVGENVVSVGDYLVQLLEQAGIHAIHDRQLHDAQSYTDAYGYSRASVRKLLEEYPQIRLVLDLHRDAVADSDGNQLSVTIPGTDTARLMLVVGSDAGGLSHSKWPENMSLAVKLHAELERLCPGICRPISFRTQRFNQDLSPGALLVEVGAAGNTHQQALKGAEYLAKAIIGIASGTTS